MNNKNGPAVSAGSFFSFDVGPADWYKCPASHTVEKSTMGGGHNVEIKSQLCLIQDTVDTDQEGFRKKATLLNAN